jgi:hypothetical protein
MRANIFLGAGNECPGDECPGGEYAAGVLMNVLICFELMRMCVESDNLRVYCDARICLFITAVTVAGGEHVPG